MFFSKSLPFKEVAKNFYCFTGHICSNVCYLEFRGADEPLENRAGSGSLGDAIDLLRSALILKIMKTSFLGHPVNGHNSPVGF